MRLSGLAVAAALLVPVVAAPAAAPAGRQAEPSVAARALTGTARDAATGAALPGVRVSILDAARAVETDARGAFRLDDVPEGGFRVLFEKDGYLPAIASVRPGEGRPGARLDVRLEPLRREIAVTAERGEAAVAAAASGREISGSEARSLPGTFEDVSRALQIVPGVASSGDFKNDLIVRGGSPAENLFLLDGLRVPGLSHFGSQGSSGGAMGLLNPDLVAGLEFWSGGFPARYGDKLSSVTNVRLREGDRAGIHSNLGLSLFEASVSAEGPLPGRTGSWIVSGRKDYFSVIPRNMTIGLTVVPDYADVQAKAVLDVSRRVRVALLGLAARDDLRIEDADDPPETRMTIGIGDHLYLGGASARVLLGSSGAATVTASRTDGLYTYGYASRGEERYSIRSRDIETGGEIDLELAPVKGLEVQAGASLRRLESEHAVYYRGGYIHVDRMGYRFTKTSREAGFSSDKTAAYVQAGAVLARGLTATAGLRLDRFDYIDRTAASPRLGIRWDLGRATSIHASYGLFTQAPETFWLAAHPDNASLPYLRSEHAVVGLERRFGGGLRLGLEVFDKRIRDYPVDPANPYLTLANLGGSMVPTYFGSKLVAAGTGTARGAELSLEGRRGARFSWLADYSYSVVRYRALDGVLRNGDFDYRHVANVAARLRLTPTWEVSARWRLMGGQPYTPFDLAASLARDSTLYDLTRINTLRYPAYHRLDLRVERRWTIGRWTIDASLDVQNVYDRRNVYYRYWDDGAEHTVYYLPLVPFVGIRAGF